MKNLIILIVLSLSACADQGDGDAPVGAAGAPAVGEIEQAFWGGAQGCYLFNTDPTLPNISPNDQRKAAVAIATSLDGASNDPSWAQHFWVRTQDQGIVAYQPERANSLVYYARQSLDIGGCAGSPSRQTKAWTVMQCGWPDLAGCLNSIHNNPNSNMPPNFHTGPNIAFSTRCNSDTLYASSVTVKFPWPNPTHIFLTQPWNGWGGICETSP